ncbi:hypothetical protein ABLE92_07950 [Gordonia sp. VNQ95]|uniref:hypothetical protein n=1 Tax=Gordonia TaxID=2053 RepID=UPI0032B50A18
MGRTPSRQAFPDVLEAVQGGDTVTVLRRLRTLDDTTMIDARRWYRAVGRKTARSGCSPGDSGGVGDRPVRMLAVRMTTRVDT